MCKICKNINILVEYCVRVRNFFQKPPGCALIGACALIRTNTVIIIIIIIRIMIIITIIIMIKKSDCAYNKH